jgi:hypothetical protein
MTTPDDKATKPVQLQDARVMQRMGLPLNTPVETRTFSKDYSKHWLAMMDAHGKFMTAMFVYCSSDQSPSRWHQVKRKLHMLDQKVIRAIDTLEQLGEAGLGSEQEQHEYALLRMFVVERALPFLSYWNDAIEAVEAGGSLTITASDIPRWTEQQP